MSKAASQVFNKVLISNLRSITDSAFGSMSVIWVKEVFKNRPVMKVCMQTQCAALVLCAISFIATVLLPGEIAYK